MTAGTLPRSTHSESCASLADDRPEPARRSARPAGELPPEIGDWSVKRVAAGWWLSGSGRPVPPAVRSLRAEPGRSSLVIDADGPDQQTDRLLRGLSPVLSSAGISAVRLVLSAAAARYAKDESYVPGIDLIAAPSRVVVTPHGYALVRASGSAAGDSSPQWCRRLPGGECVEAGMLAPSPDWERGLAVALAAEPGPDLRLDRVPAGLALGRQLGRQGSDASFAAAREVWPDPERPVIVVDATLPLEMIHETLAAVTARLAQVAGAGIRLYWPRAGAGFGPQLRELARQAGIDLIAPAADVRVSDFGGMSRGPAGAAPWLLFGPDGSLSALGALYPESAWEQALAESAVTGLPPDITVEDVAAGLCVYRPGRSVSAVVATARSVLPDPARITVIAAGDAGDEVVRRDVATVLGRLPDQAAGSVRLLLTGAGAGGADSYAQSLADSGDCEIVAPVGAWTATPDGRVMALRVPGAAAGPGAGRWQTFRPGGAGQPPQETAEPTWVQPPLAKSGPAKSGPAQSAPAQSAPAQSAPAQSAPAQSAPAQSAPASALPAWAPLASAPPAPAPTSVEPAPASAPPAPAQPPAALVEPELIQPAPAKPELEPGSGPEPAPGQVASGPVAPSAADAVVPDAVVPDAPAPNPVVPDAPAPNPVVPDAPAPNPVVPDAVVPAVSATPSAITMPARDRRSTAAERAAYRDSAENFHSHSVSVRRMMTQRPGLRSAAGESQEAAATDFAAAIDYLSGDRQPVAAALRSGTAGGNPLVPCVLSGLRRLPSFAGAVYSSASPPAGQSGSYVIGQVLIEPAFVEASSSPQAALAGAIEYVIWSQTGKRVAALLAEAGRDEVIFAAGTSYRVLQVDPLSSGAGLRVFLRELKISPESADATAPGAAAGSLADADQKVLERLRPAALLRDRAMASEQAGTGRPVVGSPIGLNDHGVPFSDTAAAR